MLSISKNDAFYNDACGVTETEIVPYSHDYNLCDSYAEVASAGTLGPRDHASGRASVYDGDPCVLNDGIRSLSHNYIQT
jgi:hypothetical protein